MLVADCERLVDGWLVQPVNAVSSLAFVLVGVWVLAMNRRQSGRRRALAVAFGVSMALVGIGSFAFHRSGSSTADLVHDGSMTTLLVLIIAFELGERAGWRTSGILIGWAATATTLMGFEWIRPEVGDPLNAPLALLAVLGVMGPQVGVHRTFRPETGKTHVFVAVAILGTGAIIMLLSRTGGPFCVPDAAIHGHAIWHVLAAIGIGVYAVSGLRRADRR